MTEAIPKVKKDLGRGRVLDRIVAAKRVELEALQGRQAELRDRAGDAPPARDFAGVLRHAGEVRLLAEVKRRSPSAGEIRPGADAAEIARAYVRGGAAALSVLTDREFFGGSLEALREVRVAVDVPLLRKDFVLGEAQVWEARAAGADAILLIVRILAPERLRELRGLAERLGMAALVEAHDASELDAAMETGATLIGVNNRDLQTFRVDLATCESLAERVPADATLVGESGIRTAADVIRLGAAGIDAVLVGESLMRQPDIAGAARSLVGHSKRQRSGGRG